MIVKSLCFECFDWKLTLAWTRDILYWIEADQCWRCEPYGLCDACLERPVTVELAVS